MGKDADIKALALTLKSSPRRSYAMGRQVRLIQERKQSESEQEP